MAKSQWKNPTGNHGLQKYGIIACYCESYPRQTASRMRNNENCKFQIHRDNPFTILNILNIIKYIKSVIWWL